MVCWQREFREEACGIVLVGDLNLFEVSPETKTILNLYMSVKKKEM